MTPTPFPFTFDFPLFVVGHVTDSLATMPRIEGKRGPALPIFTDEDLAARFAAGRADRPALFIREIGSPMTLLGTLALAEAAGCNHILIDPGGHSARGNTAASIRADIIARLDKYSVW